MLVRSTSRIDALDDVVRFQTALVHVVPRTAAGAAMGSDFLALEFPNDFEFQVHSLQLPSIEVL
jgi:hypothetical protein